MQLSLDHIIVGTYSPESQSAQDEAKYAIKRFYGGEHEQQGTYNYLANLGNESYIEWLGLRDDRLASSSANPLIKALVNNLNDGQDGKIFQFALQTDDITFFKKRFIEKGIPYVGPLVGSRVNDQGVGLKWQMLFPIGKDEEQLPFLIEWENDWQERTAGFPMNDKVLERLFFRGLSLARFQDIYGTHAVVRNELLLKNCRLSFIDEGYSHIHVR